MNTHWLVWIVDTVFRYFLFPFLNDGCKMFDANSNRLGNVGKRATGDP